MREFRLWSGRPGSLAEEVRCLRRHLADIVEHGELSLRLSPQERSDYDWMGREVPSTHHTGKPGQLVLFTSGTTGTPKSVDKDYLQYFASKRGSGRPEDRWLLTYSPSRWAGISILTHVAKHGSELIVPETLDTDSLVEAGVRATHISLTPSLFRKILMTTSPAALARMRLEQITFGGEQASQDVLDKANSLWGSARITHTYASTEAGDICSCSDGLAGYPEQQFSNHHIDTTGELIVNGLRTGDLWELRGERYYFAGRMTEVVNVAGTMISLRHIEDTANQISGVHQARCYSEGSPITGAIVCLDYVGSIDRREVLKQLRDQLPKSACPSLVRRMEEIELSEAGKIRRSQ